MVFLKKNDHAVFKLNPLLRLRGIFGWSFPGHIFDHCHGTIAVNKRLISNAANVSLSDFINLVYMPEQLAPIAEAQLIMSEFRCQTRVVVEPANQVGFLAGLHHLEVFVAYILVLQTVNLFPNSLPHFLRSVARKRNGQEGKQSWIFRAGKTGKPKSRSSSFLVSYQ